MFQKYTSIQWNHYTEKNSSPNFTELFHELRIQAIREQTFGLFQNFEQIMQIGLGIGEGTLPWAIFRSRIFSNYFSQKFEKKNNGLKEW